MNSKAFSWLNVLLIDDSPTILNYVSAILTETFDIENVYAASSAQEAMQVLKQSEQINLLFLDLNMPQVDGIQFLEKIKKLNYKGYIVIMSGVSTKIISSVEQLTKQYGLNYIGALFKPIHESDLLPILEKIGQSRNKHIKAESLKTYEIIRAIKNEDFEVLYQPQINLSSRKMMGVEALCRMNHPRLGLVSPDRFIDKAEESELIIHITLAVLKIAFADWQSWANMGLNIKLSVNASPIALEQKEFSDIIFSLLHQFNMSPEDLCIEVTESVLADDKTQELMNLSRLNMRGIDIALDDFGKENSTIERLQKLPLSYLKLDKSYFLEHKDSLGQFSLINTSLALANKLKISTIAEGIEDSNTLAKVTEMGCDFAQGYYIAKPMTAEKILSWEKNWHNLT